MREACNDARLALLQTTRWSRVKGLFSKARRHHYELTLLSPGGSAWVLLGFDGTQEEEANAAFAEAAGDPVQWARDLDASFDSKGFRLAFTNLLHEAQVRTTGFMQGDCVESTQLVELPVWGKDAAILPAGARMIVNTVWLGVQRGVACNPIGRIDLVAPFDPTQLRLIAPAPHPARLVPKHWVYEQVTDTWHVIKELA